MCLAVPLYEQLELLKKNKVAVVCGILSGTLASLTGIFVLCMLFGFNHQQYVTMLPKSITTAIGIGISEELGGIVTITVAVIIITGILGNVIADTVFHIFKIKNPLAKGLEMCIRDRQRSMGIWWRYRIKRSKSNDQKSQRNV